MQRPKTHLILALCAGGFGETLLGMRLANELVGRGERIRFLAHESNRKLMFGLPNLLVCDPAMVFLSSYCEAMVRGQNLGSIILADYAVTSTCLQKLGIDPHFLQHFGVPIYAIDTWHAECTGLRIDLFDNQTKTLPMWTDIVRFLGPVPFLNPASMSTAYRCLPQIEAVSRKARHHVRRNLGVEYREKAILFCSAVWQHHDYKNEAAVRTGSLVPSLLPLLLNALGTDVHLVHVGPQSYGLEEVLPERYHWLPPLGVSEFDTLLGSMDLLLSANFSASIISKAMLLGIPTVVVHNSHRVASVEQLRAVAPQLTDIFREVFEASLPMFPFLMWPLGYANYLRPLIQSNPYLDTMALIEILEIEKIIEALRGYLFDEGLRTDSAARQAAYLAQVQALPRAVDLMTA